MNLRKRFLFACLVCLFVLAGAELIARLVFPDLIAKAPTMQFANPHRDQPESFVRDPLLFWRLKPNNPTWEVNAAGFRGPARDPNKRPGVLRICCLGDSCTFGLSGKPLSYAQTYPALLETALSTRLGRPVEALNFGCPGYTSFQGLNQLATVAASYKPDIVTAYFGTNDGFEAIGYPDEEQRMLNASSSGFAADLQRAMQGSAIHALLTRGVTWAHRATAPSGLSRVSFEAFRRNAAAMRELGAKNGFRVLFIPTYYLDENGALAREEISVVEPLVDLQGAFVRPGLSPTEVISPPPDRVHPTALGHRLIAEALTARLTSELNNASSQEK